MKVALNNLERATSASGRFSAGAEDNNLGGDAGWLVWRASINLIISATKGSADVASMASSLVSGLSSVVDDALATAGSEIKSIAAVADSVLSWVNGKLAYALLWNPDQALGKKYLERFLNNTAVAIAALATAYLAALKAGTAAPSAPSTPTAPTATTTTGPARPGGGRYDIQANALTQPQVVFNEDTTPIRPSLAKPALVIGGAVAVAAFLLLR
jgi:hypothetical protein